jgi:hypothetical protein
MNVSLGMGALMRMEMMTFDEVDIPYAYKAIFGRGVITSLRQSFTGRFHA